MTAIKQTFTAAPIMISSMPAGDKSQAGHLGLVG